MPYNFDHCYHPMQTVIFKNEVKERGREKSGMLKGGISSHQNWKKENTTTED